MVVGAIELGGAIRSNFGVEDHRQVVVIPGCVAGWLTFVSEKL